MGTDTILRELKIASNNLAIFDLALNVYPFYPVL